jgi:hypothetical protein
MNYQLICALAIIVDDDDDATVHITKPTVPRLPLPVPPTDRRPQMSVFSAAVRPTSRRPGEDRASTDLSDIRSVCQRLPKLVSSLR